MATTKGKDSSSLGKEKSIASSSPNSRTTITKTRPKTPTTSTTVPQKASPTATEKQVPSYLRPTISSRPSSFKYVKKSADLEENSPQKASSNRRRSFDTTPPSSRLQTSSVSSSPRERTVTVRSTSFQSRSSTSPKPAAERASKTPKSGKSQPVYVRAATKKSTTPVTKKETNIASASAKAPPQDVEVTQDDGEVLVHEVEEVAEVEGEIENLSEVPRCENDELSSVVDSEVSYGEDATLKLCDIPAVLEEQENLTAHTEEPGDHKEQEEQTENQPEGEEINGAKDVCNETHPEESVVASEAIVEVEEDKGEEGSEDKEQSGDENKHNEKEEVDEGSKELNLKEEQNVEGGVNEETKPEDVANGTEEKKKEENVDGHGVEVTKPEEVNSAAISSKRQVGWGKKESQAYNDVIEETANKLLEKRKNKVKALVGAFETVIDKEASSK